MRATAVTVEPAGTARAVRAAARMTALGVVMTLFPALVVALAAASGLWLIFAPGWRPIVAGIASLYVLPLVAYRLHALCFPLREGGTRLAGHGYSPWYGSHQLQAVYVALPLLETLLRLVPGAYSAWLRLWGSRVGRGVYWTPHVDIVDRGLVEIGDRVIFGHRSGVISHVIRPTKDNLLLYVARVRIGDGAFIGAGSYLGPGAVIEPRAMVPATKHVFPREKVTA
jgi:hypothetical protein